MSSCDLSFGLLSSPLSSLPSLLSSLFTAQHIRPAQVLCVSACDLSFGLGVQVVAAIDGAALQDGAVRRAVSLMVLLLLSMLSLLSLLSPLPLFVVLVVLVLGAGVGVSVGVGVVALCVHTAFPGDSTAFPCVSMPVYSLPFLAPPTACQRLPATAFESGPCPLPPQQLLAVNGAELSAYRPPGPPPGSGFHRYQLPASTGYQRLPPLPVFAQPVPATYVPAVTALACGFGCYSLPYRVVLPCTDYAIP